MLGQNGAPEGFFQCLEVRRSNLDFGVDHFSTPLSASTPLRGEPKVVMPRPGGQAETCRREKSGAMWKRGVPTCAPRVTRLSVLSEDTTRFAGLGLISFHSPFNAAGEAFSLCNFPR